ncbi:hypothetical protein QYE76_006655 [Lolium multiflorum]|uniref:DUF4216 domain-containing protein n=1 Tax=Lolium multiflorum TaxID=4521 RepID=A0AAD8W1Y3_LOLMU|nr:hypothetical protein QYE76_006655 [Lolium multiflorum]
MISPVDDDVDEAALADNRIRRIARPRIGQGSPAGMFRCGGRGGPRYHPWRNSKEFNGASESREKPAEFTPEELKQQLDRVRDVIPGKLQKKRKREDGQCWSRRSCLWDFPYWEDLKLRHNIDVMHIEKNICDNLIGTFMNIQGKTKDTVNSRLDLEDMGIRRDLHLQPVSADSFEMPQAWYTMSKQEKIAFCEFIKAVRFPDGYASNISKCVASDKCKLQGMKTHDCHILLQRILPAGLRGTIHEDIYEVVAELGNFFRELCCKTLKRDVLDRLEKEIVGKDYDNMVWYVLRSCPEVDPYIDLCKQELNQRGGQINVDRWLAKNFARWFQTHIGKMRNDVCPDLYALACKPDFRVRLYSACVVDSVRYHTVDREKNRKTQNSGIVSEGDHDGNNIDFFGQLKSIIRLQYNSSGGVHRSVVLFRFDWFDLGGRKPGFDDDGHFKSVNTEKFWYKNDPFILTSQATKLFIYKDIYEPMKKVRPMQAIDVEPLSQNDHFEDAIWVTERMGLHKLMKVQCDCSIPLIKQFYATMAFKKDEEHTMQWMSDTSPCEASFHRFAEILGYPFEGGHHLHGPQKIDKDVLYDLYDWTGAVGTITELLPIYGQLLRFFRATIGPSGGNNDALRGAQDGDETSDFTLDVMDYIIHEINDAMVSRTTMPYAPYIQLLINSTAVAEDMSQFPFEEHKFKKAYVKKKTAAPTTPASGSFMGDARSSGFAPDRPIATPLIQKQVKKLNWFQRNVLCMNIEIHKENF